MKKLVLFLALLISYAVSAQIATVTLKEPASFAKAVSPTAAASIYKVTNNVAGYILFKAPVSYASTQDFTIKLDSVAGNHTNVAVAIYGQKSPAKGDWTQIGSTVNWVGVSKPSLDTTIVISNATANRYQRFKYVITGTGTGVTKVSFAYLKLWK